MAESFMQPWTTMIRRGVRSVRLVSANDADTSARVGSDDCMRTSFQWLKMLARPCKKSGADGSMKSRRNGERSARSSCLDCQLILLIDLSFSSSDTTPAHPSLSSSIPSYLMPNWRSHYRIRKRFGRPRLLKAGATCTFYKTISLRRRRCLSFSRIWTNMRRAHIHSTTRSLPSRCCVRLGV